MGGGPVSSWSSRSDRRAESRGKLVVHETIEPAFRAAGMYRYPPCVSSTMPVRNLTVRPLHSLTAALPLFWWLPSFRHPTVHHSTRRAVTTQYGG